MCGIMGYIGPRDAAEIVLKGLECLEYRGYDSAGIALAEGHKIGISKCVGSVANLRTQLEKNVLSGKMGIGHTRWATHGGVTRENAHPHVDADGRVVLIHNGIVENFHELGEELVKQGAHFTSETDTEIVAFLISSLYKDDPLLVIREACARLRGSFAFVILFADVADRYYCVRKGPPLVLGTAEGETFCASDVTALLPYTHNILFMEDGEIAELSAKGISLYGFDGVQRKARLHTIDWDASMTSKGMYPHFMLKEIEEQGNVLRHTLSGRIDSGSGRGIDLQAEFPFTDEDARKFCRIHFVACGTSCHAAAVAGRLADKYTGMDVRVEAASEYRYGSVVCNEQTLAVFVSQSGETADTLAAARQARTKGARCLAVTNMVNSSLAREVGSVLELRAGPEIGVAATKTFIGQLAALTLLALWIGKQKGRIGREDESRLAEELVRLPLKLEKILGQGKEIREMAERYKDMAGFLFIGRGASNAIGMEGALKLKEISYVHAEAHAAGEMKHGPIAILDVKLPVVAIVPKDDLYEKTLSNIQEARARKAPIIAIASQGDEDILRFSNDCFFIPETENELTPLLTVVPLQLFAYHLASILGREIDRPRNLAKSVTVE
ncbi:MAG: glutamine--fructose-6-phosphate transaminase (isomerizing) [Synergistaceae bacterium]|nr:glutamine--fructose-6-phosphate transaminase (isomerizing) [Synergistaceae bacterium]